MYRSSAEWVNNVATIGMTLSASLRLRPTRIGFLVDPTDMDSLRRVFQVCTCLWGGTFNPIIPVCSTIPEVWTDSPFPAPSPVELAKGYLNFFEPDVFVETRAGLVDQVGISKTELDFGHSRIISIEEYFREPGPYPFCLPLGTDVFDIYKAVFDREFKFVSRHERRVAFFESASPFLEAAFGGFPAEGPLASLGRAYLDAFDPVKLVPSAENWVKVIKEDFRLPLSFTMETLKPDHNGWSMPTLFVVDPTSTLDLIDLWNIRQFHPSILPVNAAWLQDAKEYLAALIKANYRPLPGNPNGVMIQLEIQFGRSMVGRDHEKAFENSKALLSDAGLIGLPLSIKPWYDRIWKESRDDDFVHRLHRAEVSSATSDLELSMSTETSDLSCRFPALAPGFADRPTRTEKLAGSMCLGSAVTVPITPLL